MSGIHNKIYVLTRCISIDTLKNMGILVFSEGIIVVYLNATCMSEYDNMSNLLG